MGTGEGEGVSPEFRLRPSLSVFTPKTLSHRFRRVAGVQTPAFVERRRVRIGPGVVGGVKPRINGEQHAPGTTRCSAGRQGVTSRQAATRLLRCAPALQVTRRNPLTRLVFMAGSELPAIAGPIPRSRRSRCQPLHLVFAIYRRFFAAVNTRCMRAVSPEFRLRPSLSGSRAPGARSCV